jgi:hypothetical protein
MLAKMALETPMSKCGSDFADIQDNFSKLSLRKPSLPASTQPSAAELQEKLSDLRAELSTPSTDKKSMDLLLSQDAIAGSDGISTGNDSGYASLVSTPQTSKGQVDRTEFTEGQFQASKLKYIDKPIPGGLRDRFFDLKMLYSEDLWKAVSKKKSNPGDISMKLKYLGDNEFTAQLYIVIHCERGVSKKVKKFFAQAHVLEELRNDFQVRVFNTGLLRLSTSKTVVVYSGAARRNTLCGMPIEMNGNNASAVATLGGLIIVSTTTKTTIYGITAGHPLAKIYQDSPDSVPPLEEDDSDDSDDEVLEDSDFIELSESNSVDFSHDNDPFLPQTLNRLGSIQDDSLHSSLQAGNRDWALIEITAEEYLPNLLVAAQPRGQETETSTKHETPDEESIPQDLFCTSEEPALSSPQRVVVITCRGFQRGTLAANASSILMAPGTTFVDALDFLPDTRSSKSEGVASQHTTELTSSQD